MDKNATTPLRVIVISVFALSCFSLLLFLWMSFGGPVPLKAEGYTVKASFPDAVQLAEQAEVRVAGVTVGRVVSKVRDPDGNRTLATIKLDPEYAPLKSDARAMLRQKTLLGETYVELTTGTKDAASLPEGARLADTRVEPTVEFDELLRIFDPDTRKAFQLWQSEQAKASAGRGADINAAFGSFPEFTGSASDLLEVLDQRKVALKSLIKDTGTTFAAISRDEGQLRNLITSTGTVFRTTASQREKLAETFRIFPTFLDESKATLARLQTFARQTDPLLVELRPALEDLQPTLVDVRRLSPSLQSFFESLPPLIRAGRTGLPALSRVLRGLSPVFEQTSPFLAQLNPIFQLLETNQYNISDFISIGGSATALKLSPSNGSTGHALPQLIVGGSQTLAAPRRTADNRGSAYPVPGYLADPRIGSELMFPSWDCNHVGGEKRHTPGTQACWVEAPWNYKGLSKKYPRNAENDYSKK
ncbi:MAG TPA: MlaD family protein [Solirubrobacteraceae bacterium]|jgi:virulence factor Mce-like protein